MKHISFLTLAVLLSFSSCSHLSSPCCKNKNVAQCTKEKCDKPCCDKEMKCKDGSCAKKAEAKCQGDSCNKKS